MILLATQINIFERGFSGAANLIPKEIMTLHKDSPLMRRMPVGVMADLVCKPMSSVS